MTLLEALQKNNYELEIDEDLGFDADKIALVRRFIGFCFKELGLSKHCTIRLVSNRESHGIKTTAYWREQDQLACIYAKGRMLVDVMRSLAHELVHKQQFEQEKITSAVPDIGGPIEDEANAVAGVLIKKFLNYDSEGSRLVENFSY